MAGVPEMSSARQGTITPQMRRVAEREGLPAELIRDESARGRLIIPAHVHHLAQRLDPMAIGAVARVKINATMGSSAADANLDQVLAERHKDFHHRTRAPMDASSRGG